MKLRAMIKKVGGLKAIRSLSVSKSRTNSPTVSSRALAQNTTL